MIRSCPPVACAAFDPDRRRCARVLAGAGPSLLLAGPLRAAPAVPDPAAAPAADAAAVAAAVAAAAPATSAAPAAAAAPASAPAATRFGTFRHPFAPDSPWNVRPVDPELGPEPIPRTKWAPMVAAGSFSVRAFEARRSDPPVRILGASNAAGPWLPDAEAHGPVSIPHWPADVEPAEAEDGHADIVDVAAGIVHSLFQLRRRDAGWVATQYAWTRLDGPGCGDPAHYFQGARAAGVPPVAGLIRAFEIDEGHDGDYGHVLAMSLDGSALRRGYEFPATSEDANAPAKYTGPFPMGTLMMLPPRFDAESLRTPVLRRVARTLQSHGARVVDQNVGTRFGIYVEIGAALDIHPPGGWNPVAAQDLNRIADALRPVRRVGGWLDGLGRPATLMPPMNLMSMRGDWPCIQGAGSARFDSPTQSVQLQRDGAGDAVFRQQPGRWYRAMPWSRLQPGHRYRLSAEASDGVDIEWSGWSRTRAAGPGAAGAIRLAGGGARTLELPPDVEPGMLSARLRGARRGWASVRLVPLPS